MVHEISVHWSWNQTHLNPVDSFCWPTNFGFSREKYQYVESTCKWPEGTLSCLDEAFSRKLGRQTGWILENNTPKDILPALIKAASIYKRGVHWTYRERSTPSLSERGSYQILIPPTNTSLATVLGLLKGNDFFAVIDENVEQHWKLTSYFPQALIIGITEHTKNPDTVARIIDHSRQSQAPKNWLIIGGGVLGDVAAFAASICNAQFCLMPTTLLAMADACVGGKTGVNYPPFGKNQLGSFAFPDRAIAWPGWLSTLPARERKSGGVECMKHGFLTVDQNLTKRIVAALNEVSVEPIGLLLPEIINIKAEIIAQDPNETGIRASLNLGHTLAHALEAISQERCDDSPIILHGEAVAIGLVMAAIISQKISKMPTDQTSYVIKSLNAAGCLPTVRDLQNYLNQPDLGKEHFIKRLIGYIGQDKKNATNEFHSSKWVLLESLGKIAQPTSREYTTPISQEIIEYSWHELIQYLNH